MKQFCMKIDLISQGRENAVFMPSIMAAMTSHENALFESHSERELKKINFPGN